EKIRKTNYINVYSILSKKIRQKRSYSGRTIDNSVTNLVLFFLHLSPKFTYTMIRKLLANYLKASGLSGSEWISCCFSLTMIASYWKSMGNSTIRKTILLSQTA